MLNRSIACILLVVALIGTAVAQDVLKDYLLEGDTAIGIKPPISISGPGVQAAEWSPEGRYLLLISVVRPADSAPPGVFHPGEFDPAEDAELRISIWDSMARQTRDLMSLPAHSWAWDQHLWLNGADVAYVVLKHFEMDAQTGKVIDSKSLLQINADHGTFRQVTSVIEAGGAATIDLVPSPTLPVAILTTNPSSQNKLTQSPVFLLDPRSEEWPQVAARELKGCYCEWSPDGKVAYAFRNYPPDDKNYANFEGYELSFADASFRLIDRRPPTYRRAADSSPLKLVWSKGVSVSAGTTAKYDSLWLQGKISQGLHQVLLAAEADHVAAISPKNDLVFYVSKGVPFIRLFALMSREDFLATRKDAEREGATARAKHDAIALMMYATDYDGKAPKLNEDYRQTLSPYIKDDSDLADLTLVWSGLLSNLETPSKTVWGYVQTSSGKAVIYADAHVEWQEVP